MLAEEYNDFPDTNSTFFFLLFQEKAFDFVMCLVLIMGAESHVLCIHL